MVVSPRQYKQEYKAMTTTTNRLLKQNLAAETYERVGSLLYWDFAPESYQGSFSDTLQNFKETALKSYIEPIEGFLNGIS